jgi:Ca2+-binding EF-hand superfamily protein
MDIDEATAQNLFETIDKDGSNSVDFKELVCFLSVLCSDSVEQKLQRTSSSISPLTFPVCFSAYDVSKSGFLRRQDVDNMARSFASRMSHASGTPMYLNVISHRF